MPLRFTVYQGQPILVANFFDTVKLSQFREWGLRLPYYTRMFENDVVYHIIDISRAEIDVQTLKSDFEAERGQWGHVDLKHAGGKRVKAWIVGDTPATKTIFHLIGKPELGDAYLPILSSVQSALYAIHGELHHASV